MVLIIYETENGSLEGCVWPYHGQAKQSSPLLTQVPSESVTLSSSLDMEEERLTVFCECRAQV